MISSGLLLLGVIQTGTGLTALFSYKKDEMFGVKTLKGDLAVHRYMLVSLWLSVGILYLLGAFYQTFTLAALVLGIINVLFEIIGYWLGFKNNKRYWWYPYAGTAVMGAAALLCAFELYKIIT